MTLARSRLDTPAGYWRVGDTDEYVDYWSPAAPTRWDNVDNMFDELRIRIAAVQETLVARELEPELDGSAAVEAAEKSQDFVDRLERQVYADQAAHDASMRMLKEQLQRRNK